MIDSHIISKKKATELRRRCVQVTLAVYYCSGLATLSSTTDHLTDRYTYTIYSPLTDLVGRIISLCFVYILLFSQGSTMCKNIYIITKYTYVQPSSQVK